MIGQGEPIRSKSDGPFQAAAASASVGSAEALDPMDLEDREWVAKFQSGKEEGFNRLVLRHKDRIFTLCFRMLQDRSEADDAAQETFVRVFHGLKEFRMEAKFSSWLYRIAVNVCKNKLASQAYRHSRDHQNIDAAERGGGSGSGGGKISGNGTGNGIGNGSDSLGADSD